jgi:hypothetical protein
VAQYALADNSSTAEADRAEIKVCHMGPLYVSGVTGACSFPSSVNLVKSYPSFMVQATQFPFAL